MEKLYRLDEGAMVWGVLNGIADYYKKDVSVVRLFFIAFLLITGGVAFFMYIAAGIILPDYNDLEKEIDGKGKDKDLYKDEDKDKDEDEDEDEDKSLLILNKDKN